MEGERGALVVGFRVPAHVAESDAARAAVDLDVSFEEHDRHGAEGLRAVTDGPPALDVRKVDPDVDRGLARRECLVSAVAVHLDDDRERRVGVAKRSTP